MIIPTVIEKSSNGERVYDLYSRLLKDRIIIVSGEINDEKANIIIGMLLYLDSINNDDISLYINSPGGNLNEGFALIDAIKISKTPVYTINVGQWSSMSFLIGITGHKRFSLPSATFLMHDGSSGAFGSTSKVQDCVEFEKRFKNEVIKKHVLDHSKMQAVDYDALARVEYYLLPKDALERGFIDKIVDDIDAIL